MGLDWYVEVYDSKTRDAVTDNSHPYIYNGVSYFRAKNLVFLMEQYGMGPMLQTAMYGNTDRRVMFDDILEVITLYQKLELKEIEHWTIQEQKETFEEAKTMLFDCVDFILFQSDHFVHIKASY